MTTWDSTARPGTSARRAFRFVDARQQARLATAIFGLTFVFVGLAVGNSYAAYGKFVDVALTTAPIVVGADLIEQTHHYVRVTSTLAVAYALAVLGLSVVFVHRMIGPVVALERHTRALEAGNYKSRVGLRSGHSVFRGLASQLDHLAKNLERAETATETRSL